MSGEERATPHLHKIDCHHAEVESVPSRVPKARAKGNVLNDQLARKYAEKRIVEKVEDAGAHQVHARAADGAQRDAWAQRRGGSAPVAALVAVEELEDEQQKVEQNNDQDECIEHLRHDMR